MWRVDLRRGAEARFFNGGRFDLGFYAGRIYGLMAASFVLLVAAAGDRRASTRGLPGRWRRSAARARGADEANASRS